MDYLWAFHLHRNNHLSCIHCFPLLGHFLIRVYLFSCLSQIWDSRNQKSTWRSRNYIDSTPLHFVVHMLSRIVFGSERWMSWGPRIFPPCQGDIQIDPERHRTQWSQWGSWLPEGRAWGSCGVCVFYPALLKTTVRMTFCLKWKSSSEVVFQSRAIKKKRVRHNSPIERKFGVFQLGYHHHDIAEINERARGGICTKLIGMSTPIGLYDTECMTCNPPDTCYISH